MTTTGISVTKEVLESAYEILKLTRPFNRWKLPDSSEVKFHVLKTEGLSGDYYKDEKGNHHIRVSEKTHTTLNTIMQTVAHEMCHMKDDSKAHHGKKFHRLADSVCKYHGFDRGQF